ncbi:hypothetical protein ACFE04_010291 [Oxalis oulophora]
METSNHEIVGESFNEIRDEITKIRQELRKYLEEWGNTQVVVEDSEKKDCVDEIDILKTHNYQRTFDGEIKAMAEDFDNKDVDSEIEDAEVFVFGQQGGREFMVEVEMLSRLHHPNLVKLANYYSNHHSSQDLLCYKLVSNGSLESWVHGPLEANCPIDWDNIMKITLGATRGFAYLHEDSQSCVSHGDFKERVKILENTSHLPLAYIDVLVHELHNVAESLTGELGDNVSHLSKEKVLSLMIPPTPVIDSSDWPFLKVIKGIFEGRLDNIKKADMGEDEGTANFVRQVIQATERNMNDVDELNYDFGNPFVTCGEGDFLAASTQRQRVLDFLPFPLPVNGNDLCLDDAIFMELALKNPLIHTLRSHILFGSISNLFSHKSSWLPARELMLETLR